MVVDYSSYNVTTQIEQRKRKERKKKRKRRKVKNKM